MASGIQAYLIHKMLFVHRADVTCKSSRLHSRAIGGADRSAGYLYDVVVWAEFESNVAIICACAPALKAFVSQPNKEKKPPQTFFGGASIGGSGPRTFGNGSQKVNDSGTRETCNERDQMDIEEVKENGDWSWPSPNRAGATKVVTIERESTEKHEI